MTQLQDTLILVVDDNAQNLHLLGRILNKGGYQVETVRGGDEALAFVETEIPALIILDIMMPDLDGFEVCKRLKERTETKDIPVIFISVRHIFIGN